MDRIRKRIVSFDLDMTLLDHKTWKITESALKALEILRKDNVIVIASGRNMDLPLSVGYRDQLQPDAVIHMNGTRVVAEGKTLYEHTMDKKLLKRLLAFGKERGIALGATMENGDYYTAPEEVERIDVLRWGETSRHFENPMKLLELPVWTLAYIGGPDRVRELEEHFPECKFFMFAGKTGADVVENEASKAEGLKRLCEYYGMDLSQTVAFGDSMNDFEIVSRAGIGIAMGNSVEELKAAADYVTDPIDRDGVWNACRHFGWI